MAESVVSAARWLSALVLLGFAVPSTTCAEEVVRLVTRPGVEQRFILIAPERPRASVVLFAGGKGALRVGQFLGETTMEWGRGNFLVRTRALFAARGLQVAVVDAPSDRQGSRGMLGGFRNSAAHVADIDAVITELRRRAEVPVWLVGTSRGTESATHVAIQSAAHPDGLVLTSSMTLANGGGRAVPEHDLERIAVPVMLVAHEEDGCRYTPPDGIRDIARRLVNAPRVAQRRFSGGDTPLAGPCRALSAHGFLGIEREVVDAIADFILGEGT